VQHIWWAVHILDIVTAMLGFAWAIIHVFLKEKRISKAPDVKSDRGMQDGDSTKPMSPGKT
jgi:hypothetical protein